jgi:hypothetical protein
LGERELAADIFFRLAEAKGYSGAATAYEAGCNNVLLSAHQNRERKVLQKIGECARQLQGGAQGLLWQARAAWALDQMADNLQAEERWQKLAGRSLKATPEAERAYVAMAKLKVLNKELDSFRGLRFSRTNEKPEANIGKKTKGLEEVERLAEVVIKIGTPKQVIAAKEVIRQAYLEFAETMETSALPSKLSDTEKEELNKSFISFAKDFRDKAAGLENKEADRGLASVESATPDFKLSSLSGEERGWIEDGLVPSDRAAELFAKKAYSLYRDGKFSEAKYFGEKWKKTVSSAAEGYGLDQLERFQALLAEKLPVLDPMSREF